MRRSKHLPIRKLQVLEFASQVQMFRPVELACKFYPTIRAAYVHVKKLQRQGLLCRVRSRRVAYRISARGIERLEFFRVFLGADNGFNELQRSGDGSAGAQPSRNS